MCMEKLDMITDAILQLDSISTKESGGHVIYELEEGNAISFTIKETDDVHVLDSFLSAGTVFPLHEHLESFETLILYKGEITVVCEEPGIDTIHKDLVKGEPFGIPCGMNHFLHAKKDSWILATLIPPDAGMLK